MTRLESTERLLTSIGKIPFDAFKTSLCDVRCFGLESEPPPSTAPIFKTPAPKRETFFASSQPSSTAPETPTNSKKRLFQAEDAETPSAVKQYGVQTEPLATQPPTKKSKANAFDRAAPLAERMRPRTLDEVCGQDLVGPDGVLRGLIESDRIPSMILWGSAGTGKTTIARLVASQVNARFVEINSTSSGVAECKKIFAEARSELGLTGRKTIIFCDEIHRFSKSQQDVFLAPVEAGHVTLIGATTENPSFKVQNALLSRCRTFTLSKLTDEDIAAILHRALEQPGVQETYRPDTNLVSGALLSYLASFSDGDARTALNLLELAMDLSTRPSMTIEILKSSLTKTLVYDRAGDQHYDTISAFHKSVRGSDPDAALYYLARMIQSGEDALYIARRMVVIASEDVGLADNNMLTLATATYSACEKIGLPESRINLAHCTVALCLAPKSTRAYRGLGAAMAVLREPGIAGLPIPIHLRNAPTKLMKEIGYGKEYKYNPKYVDGRVKQDYLPEKLLGRTFLEDRHLGTEIDVDLEGGQDGAESEIEADRNTSIEPGVLSNEVRIGGATKAQSESRRKDSPTEPGLSPTHVESDGEVPSVDVKSEPELPVPPSTSKRKVKFVDDTTDDPEEKDKGQDEDDRDDDPLPLSSQTEPPAEWQ